jgi:hypothetical protein
MFRLLGFLVGSVTALTIILILLGIPEFHLADRDVDQQRFDAAVKMLKEKQQEIANATEDVLEDVAETVDDIQDNFEDVAKESATFETSGTDQDVAHTPHVADEVPVIQDEMQWYSFWNPFRSEIAARGFVTQLEKVTGLDYRVVKVKTGVYEVAFAYNNDDERRTKLSQISAATGLDLPDS